MGNNTHGYKYTYKDVVLDVNGIALSHDANTIEIVTND